MQCATQQKLHRSNAACIHIIQPRIELGFLSIIPLERGIRATNTNSFELSKIQVFNNIPSQFTHAIESLKFVSPREIHGEDNYENELIYRKID